MPATDMPATDMPATSSAQRSCQLNAVLTFTLLVLLALHALLSFFTVQTWLRFNRSTPWYPAKCTPLTTHLASCAPPSARYKLSVPVTLQTRSTTLNRTAHKTATPCSFDTLAEAKQYQTRIQSSDTLRCYLAPNRQQVALEQPVFNPSHAALRAKGAALTFSLIVFTVILVIFAYLFFQYDRSQLRHSLLSTPSRSSSTRIHRPPAIHLPAITPTTTAVTFSNSDINFVTKHWATSSSPHQHDTCAVCLDDIKPDLQTAVLQLPCLHVFHQPCVTRWWKLSKPTCPYCNRNLTNDLIKLKNSFADVSPHGARHFDTQVDHSIRARRYVRTFGTLPS